MHILMLIIKIIMNKTIDIETGILSDVVNTVFDDLLIYMDLFVQTHQDILCKYPALIYFPIRQIRGSPT